MKTLQTEQELTSILEEGKTVLLFSADWCPDCRLIEPFMPEIEAEFASFNFVYIDRDQFIDICVSHDIFGIPSFLAFENGKEIGRFVSKDKKSKEEIQSFLNKL
ncbi:Thioredoxin-like protein YtpP [Paraliobacillus sp. PM-2]|uniref:thioredoxin family protein n=1 Tax=Paraliobacillus sp. PM-2 TaxID=1462524 RepID=UPI00061CC38E|nr:thioredoxin family protein [Paraliobacillus sp. PM-2]CQR48169.1 Thioredoxin-like protein YtpP [Paraliobacillus sp. PM-2]